ncbi:MAG TPA: ABC transporter substrate-binding protein [Acidimicrobiales bacterium]|nr:ABC transporter substrate-binding protein [Acidimicrobiales bacterium]
MAISAASIASVGLVAGSFATTSSASTKASTKIGGSVSVWAEWTADEETDFKAAIAPFERQTGITVNYQGKGSGTTDTAVEAAVAGGKPPDVAFVPDPGTLDTLAAAGKLTPLAPILGSEVSNYGSAWNQLGSYGGKLYGVWYKAANKNTVWYNPAEFAAAGIKSTPTTWQQLITDAGTLEAAGVTPFSLCTDIGWPVADLWQNLYLKTNGATAYDELANDTIKWTSPTVTKTFEELGLLLSHSSYLLGGTSGALANGTYPNCVNPVFPAAGTAPTAAMVIEADFVVSQIVGNSANYLGGTTGKGGAACTTDASQTPCYDFFAFPYPSGDQAYSSALQGAGDVGMVLDPTPQAKAFIRYIASATPGGIWAHLGGFTSPNKKVPLSDYPDAVTRADASELVDATSFVFSLDDLQNTSKGAWEKQLWADMLDFVRSPTSAEIKTLEPQMQSLAAKAWGK